MIFLRPYQLSALDALRSHAAAGRRRILLCTPTGGGKTVLASAIIHSARTRFDARILFIAHRLELIDQTVSQLARWGVTECGVMRANDERTNAEAPVQVATIQTLARRSAPSADIVFIDEAHRAPGDSYRNALEKYPEAVVIGLTATPCRLDGKPLGELFDVLEMSGTYTQLIADGFVIEPRVYAPRVALDLSDVHCRHGDYDANELEAKVGRPHVVGSLVDEWRSHAEGRHTVVFACTIAHSQSIVDRFRSAGVRAEHLDGTTPLSERRDMLVRLDSGAIEVVSNCGVLTEGWDQPSAKCIVMARPTLSLALYMQMAGRALRPWSPSPDEPSVIPVILDHAGNVSRHGMPHEDRQWSLTSEAKPPKERVLYRTCPACFAYVKRNPCELCGHQTPIKPREIVEKPGHLEERKNDRRTMFDAMLILARSRGYKPGFASAKYKEKYGEWPPWSWGQEAKAMLAADETWKSKLAYREQERAEQMAYEREVEARNTERSGFDALPSETIGADSEARAEFAEWLEEEGIR